MASIFATDAPTDQDAPMAATDTVTREHYNTLKEQFDKIKAADVDKSRKLAVFEASERGKLATMQPAIQELVNMEMKDNPEFTELQGVDAWSRDLHNTSNVEANMGIARLIACNSARVKRTREEASKAADREALLASSLKENEELKADNAKLTKRNVELVEDNRENNESLKKMESIVLADKQNKTKFDFSKASSREQETEGVAGAAGKQPLLNATAKVEDALFAYVAKAGSGGLRVSQSTSSHHFLGNAGAGGSSELQAILRA